MRKVKLIACKTYQGKCENEDVFAKWLCQKNGCI